MAGTNARARSGPKVPQPLTSTIRHTSEEAGPGSSEPRRSRYAIPRAMNRNMVVSVEPAALDEYLSNRARRSRAAFVYTLTQALDSVDIAAIDNINAPTSWEFEVDGHDRVLFYPDAGDSDNWRTTAVESGWRLISRALDKAAACRHAIEQEHYIDTQICQDITNEPPR